MNSIPIVTEEEKGPPSKDSQAHFATQHLLKDLKQRAISSGAVTVTAQLLKFGLNLAGTMVLSRLLSIEDFGLVAMVATVMGFMRVFKDLGLSTATVQREGITHAQVSNLFWINVAVSTVASLALAAASPLLAWFYREPRLIAITIALSSGLLLSGLTGQHLAILNRQMRYKAIAIIEIGSMLSGVLGGIVMAILGFGYWSLVGMNVIIAVVTLLLTWTMAGWRPQFPTRGSELNSLLGFGFNLTAGGLMYSVARGVDGLLIGRVYGADSLGLYSRGSTLLARPLEQFVGPMEQVFIPALSRLQMQPERYRRIFLQIYESLAVVGSVLTGLLLGLPGPIALVVLGPQWEGVTVIFAGLAAVALFVPLVSACTWLLVSQGRGRDSLKASSIVSVTTVLAFLAGMPFGAAGVAISYSIAGLLIHIPALYYIAGRQGPVTTWDLWGGLLRHLPVWGIVCGVAWLLGTYTAGMGSLVQLAVGCAGGLIAGIAFICVWPQSRRVALDLIDALQQLRKPRAA
jgi:PST family polysaccharide transporter